ncbi:hypothetical protein ABAC460_23435 [Asticcacaulis sp. AC460]|uniref:ferredoxin n=1 Tax=Asticcacaulis sp. AC460 TaxID=1282360 RepID=UPI0003C40E5F|nr:ferredoxin [Asticcacaulis sp. AC460]ESQ86467.1 hypothetical protein ABAC460_23435 [Asticcacaulis sp. AC460]
MPTPYPKNVPGDFYVEDKCCLTCNIPIDIAPDHFTMDDQQCYVSRQPQTPDELDRTLLAMNSQEVDCIHYRGEDREVIRRLVETGEWCSVDNPTRRFFEQRLRNVARVTAPGMTTWTLLTQLFEKPLMSRDYYEGRPSYRFSQFTESEHGVMVQITWHEDWHALTVTRIADDMFLFRLKAAHRGERGFSRLIHHWLKDLPIVSDVQWLSQDEFDKGLPGQPAPD